MKFLPFEEITYKTSLSPEEVLERLGKVVRHRENSDGVSFSRETNADNKAYEGTINGNSFSITRIIHYQNSFLPLINGVIERDVDGTKIRVKMRLHGSVMLLMLFIITIAIYISYSFFQSSKKFDLHMLFPALGIVYGYFLTMLGFNYEAAKSKKDLAELFEATIE